MDALPTETRRHLYGSPHLLIAVGSVIIPEQRPSVPREDRHKRRFARKHVGYLGPIVLADLISRRARIALSAGVSEVDRDGFWMQRAPNHIADMVEQAWKIQRRNHDPAGVLDRPLIVVRHPIEIAIECPLQPARHGLTEQREHEQQRHVRRSRQPEPRYDRPCGKTHRNDK